VPVGFDPDPSVYLEATVIPYTTHAESEHTTKKEHRLGIYNRDTPQTTDQKKLSHDNTSNLLLALLVLPC
jgi:hypothetical protein